MNIIDKFHNWRRKLRWNKQYKKGRWDNLYKEDEAIRYQTLIDLIKKYGIKHSRVLDLGAGEGILNERMNPEDYTYFKGIDFSKVSIDSAKNKNLQKSSYEVGDLHVFKPKEDYDVIIFNEAFYYIHETEKANALNRISEKLTNNGIIIVSIFRDGIGNWKHFKENKNLKELHFEVVNTDVENKYWKVGVYKKI